MASVDKCPLCEADAKSRCSRCKQAYCGAAHQLEHWPNHKAACKAAASASTSPASSGPTPIRVQRGNPLQAIDNPYAGKSKMEAYRWLIDCYRLRIEDTYTQSGDAIALYAGDDPTNHFKGFLKKAAKKPETLPAWWKPDVDVKGVIREATKGTESNIFHAVEKSDIVEEYDAWAPMLLRALGEKIYGNMPSPW